MHSQPGLLLNEFTSSNLEIGEEICCSNDDCDLLTRHSETFKMPYGMHGWRAT
jgi:hypothetical protein